jgi:hypothetical protein
MLIIKHFQRSLFYQKVKYLNVDGRDKLSQKWSLEIEPPLEESWM